MRRSDAGSPIFVSATVVGAAFEAAGTVVAVVGAAPALAAGTVVATCAGSPAGVVTAAAAGGRGDTRSHPATSDRAIVIAATVLVRLHRFICPSVSHAARSTLVRWA
jgi:hypothetical protein